MSEPVYVFGDDAKDYFNHLVNAPEEEYKITIFLDAGDLLEEAVYVQDKGSITFISQRRMGFGLHPNSIIAQEWSEALNSMLREDVDAVEDALLEADPRPSVQAWLAERRKLQSRVGGHQRRLYSVFMYGTAMTTSSSWSACAEQSGCCERGGHLRGASVSSWPSRRSDL